MPGDLYGLDLASYGVEGGTGAPVPFAEFRVWESRAGGAQLTQLWDLSLAEASKVVADSQGYVGFYGPDAWTDDLWLEGANGVRLLVRPAALTQRVTAVEAVIGGGSVGPPTPWAPGTGFAANTSDVADAVETRVDPGSAVARLHGKLDFTGTVAAGATLFTVASAARPTKTQRLAALTQGSVAGTLTVTAGGAVSIDQAYAAGDTLLLDGVAWNLDPPTSSGEVTGPGLVARVDALEAAKVDKGELVVEVDAQAGATDDARIDAAITAAAASARTGTVRFAARPYIVNAAHNLTGITDLTLEFAAGSTVRIGSAPTGLLADRARVFALDQCARITITGLHVLAPAAPLSGTPNFERAVIQLYRSTDCVVSRCTFDLTGTWTGTYVEPGVGTFTYGAAAVHVKGTESTRNLVADCAVTGGTGVWYAYGESSRTTVRRVTVVDAPENGFTGHGNGTAWSEDNVLEECTVLGCGRIGIEDWNKIRRTVIRDCRIIDAGVMAVSCMGVAARVVNAYVEGSPNYAGIEATAASAQIVGSRLALTAATPVGIIIDGNTAYDLGDTASGCLITGTEIRSGLVGIGVANGTHSGRVRVVDCALYDWVQRGIDLDASASISGCYLQAGLPSVSIPAGFRLGLRGGPGARVSDTEIRILAAAGGGVVPDVPVYFGGPDQTFIDMRIDGGGVTSPVAPVSASVGGTYTGLVIAGMLLTGGARLDLQYLTAPSVHDVVGTVINGDYVTQAGNRLTWSGDTNLYRSAADTLRTDDSLHVGAALRHLGSTLAFYGGGAVAKPTVTGSRGGNAALASLLTALANIGLITDSTTA